MPEKVRTVIAIAEITETTVKEAKRMFRAYKEQDVINDCYFDDDVWHLNDETRGYNFEFSLDNSEYARFKNLTGIEETTFFRKKKPLPGRTLSVPEKNRFYLTENRKRG